MNLRFDISIVISLAALLFSLLSPVLSSLISGFFRLREKKLELRAELDKQWLAFHTQRRAEVIESYIQAVGRASESATRENLSRFGGARGEVYLYVDEDLWPLLDSISSYVSHSNYTLALDSLSDLCKELSSRDAGPRSLKPKQHPKHPHNPAE